MPNNTALIEVWSVRNRYDLLYEALGDRYGVSKTYLKHFEDGWDGASLDDDPDDPHYRRFNSNGYCDCVTAWLALHDKSWR